MSEYEIDPYDEEIGKQLMREANERHVLDLQSRSWRNVWWSIGVLALLYLCLVPKWMRTIWQ